MLVTPDFPEIAEDFIAIESGNELSDILEEVCGNYINKAVCFDEYNGEVKIK